MFITPHVAGMEKVHHLLIRVMTSLEEVKETQKIHSHMLSHLLKKGNIHHEEPTLPEGVSFPLRSPAEFNLNEEKLADSSFRSGLVSIVCFYVSFQGVKY